MKKYIHLLPCLLLAIISCNTNETKGINQPVIEKNNDVPIPPQAQDKYVGVWQDINHDPNDTTELFTVEKVHDNEYTIGSLTGKLMMVENKSGSEQAEYISAWSEEGAEIQFVFDNYTQHLMMRSPFFSKELKKMK